MLHYYEPKDHFDIERVGSADDPFAYWPYIKSPKSFDQYRKPFEIFNKISIHHAKIKDRERVEKDFINGKLGVLISTSTLELGVDYPKVNFVGIVGVPFMLESIPQRVGRAGRSLPDTLYTTLAIIILRTDGRSVDLDRFIERILQFSEKALPILTRLDSRVEKGDIPTVELITDLRQEFSKLPSRIDKWKRLHDFALIAEEAISIAHKLARRSMRLAKETNDRELEQLARSLFKSIRRLHP